MSENQNKTNKNSNNTLIFTKETLGVVTVLFATLCLVFLITGDKLMYPVGGIVRGFLLGTFGYFAYAIMLYAIVSGVLLVVDKKIGYSNRFKLLLTLSFIAVALLCQVISMRNYSSLSYGEYLSKAYMLAQGDGAQATASGVIASLCAYGFSFLLTNVGSYVILGVLVALGVYGTAKTFLAEREAKVTANSSKFRSSVVSEGVSEDNSGVQIQGVKEYPVDVISTGDVKPAQKLFVINTDSTAFKPVRKNGKEEPITIKFDKTAGGLNVGVKNAPYTQTYTNELKSKLDYIKTPAKIDLQKEYRPKTTGTLGQENKPTVSDYIPARSQEQTTTRVEITKQNDIPLYEHTVELDNAKARAEKFAKGYLEDYTETEEIVNKPTIEDEQKVDNAGAISEGRGFEVQNTFGAQNNFDMPKMDEQTPKTEEQQQVAERSNVFGFGAERRFSAQPEQQVQPETVQDEFKNNTEVPNEEIPGVVEEQPAPSRILDERRSRGLFGDTPKVDEPEKPAYTSRVGADNNLGSRGFGERRSFITEPEKPEATEEKKEKPAPPINRKYVRPPLDLLQKYEQPVDAPTENHEERKLIIQQTLEDFHIPSEPQGHIQGPSITRYEMRIPTGKGISVKKVLNYDDDLKMRLKCKDGVRIEAPIPGKDLVGIEVANKVKVTVGLREVLENAAKTEKPSKSALMFAIGKDIVGNAITDNLAKGPHYLVAGATGSGKSVCLNTMIVSLIMRYSPEDLRLILIDPKSVEFSVYEHIPHLMIDEIITNPKKAIAVLGWAYEEMERRFKTFRESGQFVVDIDSYNQEVAGPTVAKMPRIVIIIDELADLMQTCKKDLESRICAIAQKARSAGIHLVLATQRPSVDVITGTIKANLPSRIAFKVTNFNDSQTILAEAGAEKLLGNGDMLYKNSTMSDLGRYQGAFITAKEVNNVCSYIRKNNVGYFDDDLAEYLERAVRPAQEENRVDDKGQDGGGNMEVSPIFLRSLWLAVTVGKISISALQRRFQIGYSKAGGIVDKMERMGYISGDEGSKARNVLMTREEFEQKYGEPPAEEF